MTIEPWDYVHKDGNNGVSYVYDYNNGQSSLATNSWGGAAAQPANTLRAFPQYVGKEGKIVGTMGIYSLGSGACLMQMALYGTAGAAAKNLYPSNLVADFGGFELSGGAGHRTWTVNLTLPQGWYWWAWNCTTAACNARVQPQAVGVRFGMPRPFGKGGIGQSSKDFLTAPRVYGLGMPSIFPAGVNFAVTGDTPCPIFQQKVP